MSLPWTINRLKRYNRAQRWDNANPGLSMLAVSSHLLVVVVVVVVQVAQRVLSLSLSVVVLFLFWIDYSPTAAWKERQTTSNARGQLLRFRVPVQCTDMRRHLFRAGAAPVYWTSCQTFGRYGRIPYVRTYIYAFWPSLLSSLSLALPAKI